MLKQLLAAMLDEARALAMNLLQAADAADTDQFLFEWVGEDHMTLFRFQVLYFLFALHIDAH